MEHFFKCKGGSYYVFDNWVLKKKKQNTTKQLKFLTHDQVFLFAT